MNFKETIPFDDNNQHKPTIAFNDNGEKKTNNSHEDNFNLKKYVYKKKKYINT